MLEVEVRNASDWVLFISKNTSDTKSASVTDPLDIVLPRLSQVHYPN